MSQIPLVSVNLATLALESFFYGIFFLLAVSSVGVILYGNRHNMSNGAHTHRSNALSFLKSPMSYGTVGLSITVTAHWILTVLRAFEAFFNVDNGSNPTAYYADISQPTEVVKTGFLIASLVLSDSMIIYRLWVVWNFNRYVVIFPVLSLLSLTACGIGITYQFSQYVLGMDVFDSQSGRWITSDAVFTLTTNVYCTSMIAWKIWKIDRATAIMSRYGSRNLMSILGIFVESAAIYSTWTIFFFVIYHSHSNLQFFAADLWPLAAGIAFMLIRVRLGLGWAHEAQRETTTDVLVSTAAIATRPTRNVYSKSGFAMRPLAVTITQTTDRADDGTSDDEDGNKEELAQSRV